MRLAMNTYVYEVAHWPIEKTLKSANRFGFTFVEHASIDAGDPCLMTPRQARDVVKMYQDLGLRSSQMLLANCQWCASSDREKRRTTLDYMKRCSEFSLELGGRQVLVCWGGGVHEPDMMPETAWCNLVSLLKEFGEWGLPKGIIVDLEMEPDIYMILHSMDQMARIIEDVNLPNIYPNVDIGHLTITREGPVRLEKIRHRIIHAHLSETAGFKHTNSIIGSGVVDFRSYIDKCIELGIEENCARIGETAVAGIEMGEPGGEVDDPDRWVMESLKYLERVLPEVAK
jgi:sugar phosphate isomerase/epimerase